MPIYKTKNENFFKKWSPGMAYVLGFIAADGSLVKNKRGAHFLDICSTDKEIIYKIKKILKSDHKINKYRRQNKNWKARYRIQIGSKEIFNDLFALGVKPRKSKTIKMPAVPKKYFSSFVRGYFDGDGTVFVGTYKRKDRKNNLYTILQSGFISGSKKFLQELKKKLNKYAKLTGGTLYFSGRGHRLFFSINDSIKLYKYIYRNIKNNFFLKRKKIIFEDYMGR